MKETRSAYPLDWPVGWKRTKAGNRRNGQFKKMETVSGDTTSWKRGRSVSVFDSIERILYQLQRMGVDRQDVVISTNVRTRLDGLPRSGERAPEDPGAAVYWLDGYAAPEQQSRCMAIDQYATVEDNLAGIAATLEAMRAIERHGGAEILQRTFSGFLALPEKAMQPWRNVLGLADHPVISRDTILATTRDLLLKHNPDTGGNRDEYETIIEARKRALEEVGR